VLSITNASSTTRKRRARLNPTLCLKGAVVSNDDPFGKLVNIVNEQLKSGRSHDEIVNMLMQSGLDEIRANRVIDTIKKSRNSFWAGISIFCFSLLFFVLFLFYISLAYLGADELTTYAKPIFISFICCSILFAVLSAFNNKIVGIFKFIATLLWFFSSVFLACVMFIYPDWSSSFIHIGGGWRGQIFGVITNLLYSLGPKGVAYFLLGISGVTLVLTWASYYEFKTGEYE